MVNAQEWLDKNYPKEERSLITELNLSGKELKGNLDLRDFINLEELDCRNNKLTNLNLGNLYKLKSLICYFNQLTKLELINKKQLTFLGCSHNLLAELTVGNCLNLEEINCSDNPIVIKHLNISNCPKISKDKIELSIGAQEWLDWVYPQGTRSEIKELSINSKHLEGSLKLKNFPNLWKFKCKHNYINQLKIVNCPKLEKINCRGNQLVKLVIKKCSSLKKINCRKNRLTNLELGKLNDLEHLDCGLNMFTKLDLSDYSNLQIFSCHESYRLTSLNLGKNSKLTKLSISENALSDLKFLQKLTRSDKLTHLGIGKNNFPPQNLEFLRKFVNLEWLILALNPFTGSLEPLRKMKKLKLLDITNTNIESGLEYLSDSLEVLDCEWGLGKSGKFYGELLVYGWNLRSWKEAHLELIEEQERESLKLFYQQENKPEILKVITGIPFIIDLNKNDDILEENYNNTKEIDYRKFYLRDKRPFSWENNQDELLLTSDKLPKKLVNIQEIEANDLEMIRVKKTIDVLKKANKSIKNYVALSYVWGDKEKNEVLSRGGKKSLIKAIKVCKLIGINHLWMDQLCIDQNNIEEKNQEVSKMRQYYSDAEATLIAINEDAETVEDKEEFVSKTLKKIVKSEWFIRSWTFQEGFLSKQTIFMFDDVLVDGRVLAQVWYFFHKRQIPVSKASDRTLLLNEKPEKIATPLGWVYHKGGYCSEDRVSLSLNQALREIRKRKRSIPIDGIYSILGLLPYGDLIKVDYSLEPNRVLFSIMQIAVKEGYVEPLSWFGKRSKATELTWMPDVDEEGSTTIKGGITIYCEQKNVNLAENLVKIVGSKYTITDCLSGIGSSPREKTLMDGGINDKTFRVKAVDGLDEENVRLYGTKETLEKIKKGDIFIIPNNEWKSDTPFAFLVSKKNSFYYSVDLVVLNDGESKEGLVKFKSEEEDEESNRNKWEKLKKSTKEEEIVIKLGSSLYQENLSNEQKTEQLLGKKAEAGKLQGKEMGLETKMEIPPKS